MLLFWWTNGKWAAHRVQCGRVKAKLGRKTKVCLVWNEVGRRRVLPFEGILRLRIVNELMLFLACVEKVSLNCFNVLS